jgi:hypothetical protein
MFDEQRASSEYVEGAHSRQPWWGWQGPVAISKSGDAGKDALSLEQIIVDAGHTPGDQLERFVDFAADLQRRRRRIGASDSDTITRSVALLAVMEQDPEIGRALADCGIDKDALAAVLSLLGPSR